MKGRGNKGFLVIFIIFVLGLLGTVSLQDTIIIQLGITLFRILKTVFIGGCVITGVGTGTFFALSAVQNQKQKAIEDKSRQLLMENEKKQGAVLSVKDKLENKNLRALLQQKGTTDWYPLKDKISQCIVQLETMDSYQDKLLRLLKNNDANTLSDANDILDRVEQHICKNVRKVLNYMEVVDAKSQEDVELVKTKLVKCCDDNDDQLQKTQEFIMALTDFINQQGDNDSDVSMLEIYKNTILESIKED